jgi:hypothetical protein
MHKEGDENSWIEISSSVKTGSDNFALPCLGWLQYVWVQRGEYQDGIYEK